MRPKHKVFTLINDTDYVAASQQLAAAGDLTLIAANVRNPWTPQGVTLTSAGVLTGITFTIYGEDADGNAQQEDITGPNANTVTSTKRYSLVTRIYGDAGTGVDSVEAGLDGLTEWNFPVDKYAPGYNVAVVIDTGTGTYTVSHGYDDIFANGFAWADMNWFDLTALTDATDNQENFFEGGLTAFQFKTTVAGAGTNVIKFNIIPQQQNELR